MDIGTMPGADQSGYAGIQLSQPQAANGQNYNATQIGAAALGQQFGELGQEYARAGLSVPNTLEIRPGYRFVIQITKDMVLRPYADQRTVRAPEQPVTFGRVVK